MRRLNRMDSMVSMANPRKKKSKDSDSLESEIAFGINPLRMKSSMRQIARKGIDLK